MKGGNLRIYCPEASKVLNSDMSLMNGSNGGNTLKSQSRRASISVPQISCKFDLQMPTLLPEPWVLVLLLKIAICCVVLLKMSRVWSDLCFTILWRCLLPVVTDLSPRSCRRCKLGRVLHMERDTFSSLS